VANQESAGEPRMELGEIIKGYESGIKSITVKEWFDGKLSFEIKDIVNKHILLAKESLISFCKEILFLREIKSSGAKTC
jgi:hypothetical protein